MFTTVSPSEMRQVVVDTFRQQSRREISPHSVEERVRVEEGRIVAYCYRAENLFAMWMVPIGLVQFYDDQGNMLRTLELTSASHLHQQRAA